MSKKLSIPKDYSFSFTKISFFDFILDGNFNMFTNIILCVQAAKVLRYSLAPCFLNVSVSLNEPMTPSNTGL
jgi:hypothetical protein